MSRAGDRRLTASRRQFLGTVLGAGVISSGASLFAANQSATQGRAGRSRVVVVRDGGALGPDNKPVHEKLREMVARGLCRLTGEADASKAWGKIVSPSDVIGLKVNCLGGPTLCTHPALADAVAESLVAAGMPAEKIVTWERTDVELERCGFRLNKSATGPRCFGTPAHDPQKIAVGGVTTRLSAMVTRETTAMINLPVLKAHALAGFSGALKNELGCIQNPAFFHGDSCRAVGDVCALEPIVKRRRLVICDALRPLFDKGPTDMPACRWTHGALLFATDPVAADLVGRAILEEKRKEVNGGKPWPLLPPATHLARAIELGLGAASLDAVEVIEA